MAVRIQRTPSSSGSNSKFTFSCWVKRAALGALSPMFSAGTSGQSQVVFNAQDDLAVYDGATIILKTNRKFRDPSAWSHIVVTLDATQSGTDKVKLYINGEQETSFATDNRSSFSSLAKANQSGQVQDVGSDGTGHFLGLMTHVHMTDNYAYAASTFGETDSTSGIWKPKTSPSVSYGTNGFFLKFENSGNLDLDSSSNGHTFSTTGTLTQNVDTPSNNFATLNPLDISRNATQNRTFSNGNLTVTTTDYIAANGSLAVSSGKWYWEFKHINSSASNIYAGGGVIKFDGWDGAGQGGSGTNTWIYATSGQKVNSGSGASFGATISAGDIIGVALDLDNGFLYFSKNGTWQNSGDPTSGSSGTGNAYSSLSGTFTAHLSDPNDAQDHDFSINFGQGYFGTTQVSSAGTAPSEGGIFEYDCPSGYQSLCTKGINSF